MKPAEIYFKTKPIENMDYANNLEQVTLANTTNPISCKV
jgi:hypothetical protein